MFVEICIGVVEELCVDSYVVGCFVYVKFGYYGLRVGGMVIIVLCVVIIGFGG